MLFNHRKIAAAVSCSFVLLPAELFDRICTAETIFHEILVENITVVLALQVAFRESYQEKGMSAKHLCQLCWTCKGKYESGRTSSK